MANGRRCEPTGRIPSGRGRRPSSQQADDPCRAIEIVALAGQLCTTAGDVLIVTARATQNVPVRIDADEKIGRGSPSNQLDIFGDRLMKLQLSRQPMPVGRQIEPFSLGASVRGQFRAPLALVGLLAECGNRELHGLQLNSRHGNSRCAARRDAAIPGNYGFDQGPPTEVSPRNSVQSRRTTGGRRAIFTICPLASTCVRRNSN